MGVHLNLYLSDRKIISRKAGSRCAGSAGKEVYVDKQINKIRIGFNGKDQREVFKILGDTNRYRIFEMLYKHNKLSVTDMAKILKISVPLASQHLKILEQSKILKKEKVGQKVFYTISQANKIGKAISKDVL